MTKVVMTNTGETFELGAAPYVSGNDIVRFRRLNHWTQADLARHMGRDIRTVKYWEQDGAKAVADPCIAREIATLIARGAIVQQIP